MQERQTCDQSDKPPYHCAPSDYIAMISHLQRVEAGELAVRTVDLRTQAGVLWRMLHYATRATDVGVDAFLEVFASDGAARIAAERRRQIASEGWTAEHDDIHERNELLAAAIWYLDNACEYDLGIRLPQWPWDEVDWKPNTDQVRQLAKAGALIAAEIDRIQRRNK